MGKQVITADDIIKRAASGTKTLDYNRADVIITPGALDKIEELGLSFSTAPEASGEACSAAVSQTGALPAASQHDAVTEQVCRILKDKLGSAGAAGLEAVVAGVVASRLSAGPDKVQIPDDSTVTGFGGVSLIRGSRVLDREPAGSFPGNVMISHALRLHDDSPLSATYMKWEKADFSRTVEAPEISILVQGGMDLIVDGKTLTAEAGDILYMDKGATVEYHSDTPVLLACVSA
ncbi:MAG: cupin domain-containing protein [Desulfobacter sp.]